MGHGEELDRSRGSRDLDPALASRLTAALERLDELDPDFKRNREEERIAQLAKKWSNTCLEMVEWMREIGQAVIHSHQLSLDMGSDGAGLGMVPWLEETSLKFKRLDFELKQDGTVIASTGGREVGTGHVDAITYDWLQRMVVEWVVVSVER